MTVISTGASPSGTEGEAQWRDLLFAESRGSAK